MPKPDKGLRFRPLKEVAGTRSKLKRVPLFHPKPIVEELPPKYCVCGKDERKKGKGSTEMIQCEGCWDWFHFDCAGIKGGAGPASGVVTRSTNKAISAGGRADEWAFLPYEDSGPVLERLEILEAMEDSTSAQLARRRHTVARCADWSCFRKTIGASCVSTSVASSHRRASRMT